MPARNNAALCLPANYHSRPANNDSMTATDAAQRRVYRWAADLVRTDPAVTTVLDWGCGSGAKLIEFFGHLDTLGADVDYRLPKLQARFPNRHWAVCPVSVDADIVLCVDVIEHLDDPLDLLRRFAFGRWQHLVISTPERELVARLKYANSVWRGRQRWGPPGNRRHCREWTGGEFLRLLKREIGPTETTILGSWNLVAHCTRK